MVRKFLRYYWLRFKYGKRVKLYAGSNIGNSSKFEGGNMIGYNSSFKGTMGYGSYIAAFSNINGKIGRFTSIGPKVCCNYGIHPYSYPFVSTSPWFYSPSPLKYSNSPSFVNESHFDEFRYADKISKFAVVIGNDCWIGEGSFITGGINIGDGAVVLAHAVVTKDIPPYAIVGGVPAKIIGYRFQKEDIQFLMSHRWWDNSLDWIKENAYILSDINMYREYCTKH